MSEELLSCAEIMILVFSNSVVDGLAFRFDTMMVVMIRFGSVGIY